MIVLDLCVQVRSQSIAEPIRTIAGELLGVELLTRLDSSFDVECFISRLSESSKRQLLLHQLRKVQAKSAFFLAHDLVCGINIDFDMAGIIIKDMEVSTVLDSLSFVRLEVSEHFPNLSDGFKNPLLKVLSQNYRLWLDDIGAGNANLEALQSGVFECVKIDKQFYWENSTSIMWPIIIKNISQYCDQIIVEGVETQHQLSTLGEGITGIQGYLYKSVSFSNVENLI